MNSVCTPGVWGKQARGPDTQVSATPFRATSGNGVLEAAFILNPFREHEGPSLELPK